MGPKLREQYTADENGNYIVNEFRINSGKVEGSLQDFGAVTQMRIDFRSNLDNWVLISEVNSRDWLLSFQTFSKVSLDLNLKF